MLPFALPAYVLAFVFVGVLDFAGPVQSGPARLVQAFRLHGRLRCAIRLRHCGDDRWCSIPTSGMLARVSFIGQGQNGEAARSPAWVPGGFFGVAANGAGRHRRGVSPR